MLDLTFAVRVSVQVRPDAKKLGTSETQDALFAFFLERVRTNLHVVLCLSPIGEAFRERCRMFPGLVNCTTIDWFTPWPSDALFEVAAKLLEPADVGTPEIRKAVCQVRVPQPVPVAFLGFCTLVCLRKDVCCGGSGTRGGG